MLANKLTLGRYQAKPKMIEICGISVKTKMEDKEFGDSHQINSPRYLDIIEGFLLFYRLYAQQHYKYGMSHLQHLMNLVDMMHEGKDPIDILEYDHQARKVFLDAPSRTWEICD